MSTPSPSILTDRFPPSPGFMPALRGPAAGRWHATKGVITVERGSDKHSPMLDDQLKHETEGLVRSGRSTHAEEWKDPEPSGEDQPDADRVPDGTQHGGVPTGMTGDDVEGRAELAGFIGKDAYPLIREQVLELVIDGEAPDRVVDLVRELPSGREFHNMNEIWSALGGSVETERF
jgi:hypothetical protein